MLVEFFLNHAKFEFSSDDLNYSGYVPELPHVHASGATLEQCRENLASAVNELLAREAAKCAAVTAPSATELSAIKSRASALASTQGEGPDSREGDSAILHKPSEPAFADILYEKHEWVAKITINRPELYNVYSSTTLREMIRAFRDAASDDRIAVVVLTGAGDQ